MTGPVRGPGRGSASRPGSASNRRDGSINDHRSEAAARWHQVETKWRSVDELVAAVRSGRLPVTVAVPELARRARALEAIVLEAEVVEVAP